MKSMQLGARLAYSSTQWLNIVASTSRMLFISTVFAYDFEILGGIVLILLHVLWSP